MTSSVPDVESHAEMAASATDPCVLKNLRAAIEEQAAEKAASGERPPPGVK
jgi:hypothetical protein